MKIAARLKLIEKLSENREPLRKERFAPTVYKGDDAKKLADQLQISRSDDASLFLYTISDSTEDRHGDTVSVKGWDTQVFEKSGAVLWAHQSRQPPVQTSKKLWVEDGALKSVAERFERGIYPFADMISDMVERGYIKMTSVGFIPFKWEIREGHEDDWWPPLDFKKQELTEYSIVPAGSNRNAFLEDMPEHDDTLKEFAEKVLDGEVEQPEEVKEQLEEAHKEKFSRSQHVINFDNVAKELKKMLTD